MAGQGHSPGRRRRRRRRRHRGATVPASAATAISSPALALPARYHYQTISLPGYPSVYINGISDAGGYAGEGCKDRNCTKVALFAASPAGKITFYTLPFANYFPTGPFNTTATGMDNAGDVVGAYTDAKGGLHGFVRRASGALTQINDPAGRRWRRHRRRRDQPRRLGHHRPLHQQGRGGARLPAPPRQVRHL